MRVYYDWLKKDYDDLLERKNKLEKENKDYENKFINQQKEYEGKFE